MEMHVCEEKTFGTRLDVIGFEASTVPYHVGPIVVEVEIIGSPVNVRVNFGEPWFAEDEVVLVEGVEDRVE